MKMPNTIETQMFAPCGMNCMVCYKHCYAKKPCAGCLTSDTGKPEHCRKCKIKDCTCTKGLTYCFQCDEFPCKQIKTMEKSYLSRYKTSLIDNSNSAKDKGISVFLQEEVLRYRCKQCGGVVSLHDAECSECQAKQE